MFCTPMLEIDFCRSITLLFVTSCLPRRLVFFDTCLFFRRQFWICWCISRRGIILVPIYNVKWLTPKEVITIIHALRINEWLKHSLLDGDFVIEEAFQTRIIQILVNTFLGLIDPKCYNSTPTSFFEQKLFYVFWCHFGLWALFYLIFMREVPVSWGGVVVYNGVRYQQGGN